MTDQAISTIFDQYHDRLVNFAFGFTSSREGAQDAVMTVFSRLHRHDVEPGALSHYLHTAVRNASYDWNKSNRRDLLTLMDHEYTPDDADVFAEIQQRFDIASALESVPAENHEVIRLVYFERLTIAEAADVMGVSYACAKSRMFRGLWQMKRLLARHAEVNCG